MSVGALQYGDRAAREVSQRFGGSFASTTTLAALPPNRRSDGMISVVGQTLYVFDADATVGGVTPGSGTGRWIAPGAGAATASLAVTYTQIAALGAFTTGYIDFAAALPAGAVVLGSYIDVTAVVDNVGDTASLTADLGVAGTINLLLDGVSLNSVAAVGAPLGTVPTGYKGAITPRLTIDSDVNLDTITKGGLTVYVLYVVAP